MKSGMQPGPTHVVESPFPTNETHHTISLGAGVQSTVLYLMAGMGMIHPTPLAAVFADTKWEPRRVYSHLEWLEGLTLEHPIPIHRVSAGNLFENVWNARRSEGGGQMPFTDIPTFVHDAKGEIAMRRRQCTQQYKIRPIIQKIREVIRRTNRTRRDKGPFATQWIGISTDEWMRTKDAKDPWIQNAYPLIEMGMSRRDCAAWFREEYPGRLLAKSACVGCPYHSNREWLRLYREDPEQMKDTERLDEWLRHPDRVRMENKGIPQYLHRSGRPLTEVLLELDTADRLQGRLFDAEGGEDIHAEECEGYCFT